MGGRSGNFRASTNQKSGKCHELSRKSNKLTHRTRGSGGGGGGFGSTFQKSGKFHELPRTSIQKCLPPPSGNFRGVKKSQKSWKCHELPRKEITKYNLTPPHPTGGGGGRGEKIKVTKHKVFKSISGMQLFCAIITLQIFWEKPGNRREGG